MKGFRVYRCEPRSFFTGWFFRYRTLFVFCVTAFSLFLSAGCSSSVVDLSRVSSRPELYSKGSLSFSQPPLSPETERVLNELGIGKGNLSNYEKLSELQKEANESSDPAFLTAFCELGFREIAEHKESNPGYAEEISLAILLNSYRYLFDPLFEEERNQLDPQYQLAASYYNRASENLLHRIFQEEKNNLAPGEEAALPINGRVCRIRAKLEKSSWLPEEIGEVRFASDYKVSGLARIYSQMGLGVPVIVSRKRSGRPEEELYPDSLSFAMTVFLRPNPSADGFSAGGNEPNLILEYYDPLLQRKVNAEGQSVALAADLTTPLSYNFIDPSVNTIGLIGLLRPDAFYQKTDEKTAVSRELAGFYLMTPPDPNKIPVILVHGLWSTPMTWLAMTGAFQNDPEIWEHYQFWYWCYPTGLPWWCSAVSLRHDLDKIFSQFDPEGKNPNYYRSVIIGHSMGGLIATLQVTESGSDVWDLISDKPFDPDLFKEPDKVKDIFFFHPNPHLTRIITIATPYKGSDSINLFVEWFADKVIVPPEKFNKMAKILNAAQLSGRKDSPLDVTNSVEAMAPGSPFLETLNQLERPDYLVFNNIIGMTESGLIFKKVDGDRLVSYASAHRDDADSELLVDSEHTCVHTDPVSIRETIRILKEHLRQSEASAD